MIIDHSSREEASFHHYGLLFPISSKGSFICTITHTVAHTTHFGASAGTRNSSIGPP